MILFKNDKLTELFNFKGITCQKKVCIDTAKQYTNKCVIKVNI